MKAKATRVLDCTMALAVSIAGMLLIITLTVLAKILNNQQY